MTRPDTEGMLARWGRHEDIVALVGWIDHLESEDPGDTADRLERSLEVENIVNYYREKINGSSRPTASSRRKISTRLKVFTADELKGAIDGFAGDRWQMVNNARRGIAWFFHSDDRVDGFASMTSEEAGGVRVCPNCKSELVDRGTVWHCGQCNLTRLKAGYGS